MKINSDKIIAIICILVLVFLISVLKRSDTWFVNKYRGLENKNELSYIFNTSERLFESGSESETTSPYFWLDSGAFLDIYGGTGKTVQGVLPSDDVWRVEYFNTNPVDTDNGYRPQNIFRLITVSQWQNPTEQVYFKINKYNMSESPNRNESNGVLLFFRYQDSQNLYYAGLRVDGTAVIKKKLNGTYYTLDQRPLSLSLNSSYDRSSNPNLLPTGTWIGEKSEVTTDSSGVVEINLYADFGKTGQWSLVAKAIDSSTGSSGKPILSKASGGIRTDFMDVEFSDYKIGESKQI